MPDRSDPKTAGRPGQDLYGHCEETRIRLADSMKRIAKSAERVRAGVRPRLATSAEWIASSKAKLEGQL